MNLRVIRTEHDYETSLKEAERLVRLHPKHGTEEAEKLEILAILIERYETQYFPIDLPCVGVAAHLQ